jgi:hypothetical protein
VPLLPPTSATAFLLLLPLSSSLPSSSSSSSLSSTLSNNKQKLNTAIRNGNVPLLADDYPPLSCALGQEDGFNPADPTMQKIMRLLLAELIDLLSSDYEFNVNDSAKNRLSYVQVPKTSNN